MFLRFSSQNQFLIGVFGWKQVRAWCSLQGDKTKRGLTTRRASEVIAEVPSGFIGSHALHERVLLRVVDALAAGWRLTLIDAAHRWPDAQRVRGPLKALNRLLVGNRRMHAECQLLQAAMAQWLLRRPRPLIVIDGSELKADRSRCLLRAGVPVGG